MCQKILKKMYVKIFDNTSLHLVLSKTHRYSVYNGIKQRKAAHPYIGEAGINKCLAADQIKIVAG